jgi:hypothetical protein
MDKMETFNIEGLLFRMKRVENFFHWQLIKLKYMKSSLKSGITLAFINNENKTYKMNKIKFQNLKS